LIKASGDLKALQNQPGNVYYKHIYLMLLGFGVENLLKGWHVASGQKMASGGKLKKTKGRPHDLAKLAESVGFPISEDEHIWLRRLSYFSRFMGRYPGPTQMDEVWEGECLIGVPWGDSSEIAIHQVVERLLSPETTRSRPTSLRGRSPSSD
jgi:hypothetical protein